MKTCKYFVKTMYTNKKINEPIYLLSIGIVSEDNRELYHQIYYKDYPNVSDREVRTILLNFSHFDMAKLNRKCDVYPGYSDNTSRCISRNTCPWIDIKELYKKIQEFTDFNKFGIPEFYGYDSPYDWVLFSQLFKDKEMWSKYFPKYITDLQQYIKNNNIKDELLDNEEYYTLNIAKLIKNLYFRITNIQK